MSEPTDSCSCKVGRSIESYGLGGLDAELVGRRNESDASLRDLADYTNRRILEAALDAAAVDLSDALYGAVDDDDAVGVLYDVLAADDTPTERVARVRTRLTQQGVDIDEVQSDWVTHTTMRTHLNECLAVDTSREASITLDDGRDTIEWARNRCASVVEQTLERLRNAGLLTTGPLELSVTIQVTCTDCGSSYRPDELLAERACDCPVTGQSD
ncbi:rod-determining factor RdfA [Haloglomus litoreum]|uniref:rod-determining factor RdfA n=1 Tax=Haloglomus litoreum TaxID=3034026 RepID=UPI0023E80B36|nr:rod-determining factor RdfA [Haloglomus sp. DT116]